MAPKASVLIVLAGAALVAASLASALPVPVPVPDVPLPPVCTGPLGGPTPAGVEASVNVCDGSVTVSVIGSVTTPDVPLPPLPDLPGLPLPPL